MEEYCSLFYAFLLGIYSGIHSHSGVGIIVECKHVEVVIAPGSCDVGCTLGCVGTCMCVCETVPSTESHDGKSR